MNITADQKSFWFRIFKICLLSDYDTAPASEPGGERRNVTQSVELPCPR
jgi:hypothetical protein